MDERFISGQVEGNDLLNTLGMGSFSDTPTDPIGQQRRKQIAQDLLSKLNDPALPPEQKEMMVKLLQRMAERDRYLGIPGAGEVGARPAGAR